MEDAQVRDALLKLRAEIEKLGPQDAAAQARLSALVADMERRLAAPEGAEAHEGLIGDVRDAVEEFEAQHPRATAILNDIMMALSNMGI